MLASYRSIENLTNVIQEKSSYYVAYRCRGSIC